METEIVDKLGDNNSPSVQVEPNVDISKQVQLTQPTSQPTGQVEPSKQVTFQPESKWAFINKLGFASSTWMIAIGFIVILVIWFIYDRKKIME